MHPNTLKQLIKECVLQVLREGLTNPASKEEEEYWSNDPFKKEATQYRADTTAGTVWYSHFDPEKNKVPPGTHVFAYTVIHNPTKTKHLRYVCCYSQRDFDALLKKWGVTKDWTYEPGHIETECFDPTSAGPNPAATEGTQDNPYPAMNAQMRQMEEENDSFGNAFGDNWAGSDEAALKNHWPYGDKNARMRMMEYSPNEYVPTLDAKQGLVPALPKPEVPDPYAVGGKKPKDMPASGEEKYLKQQPGGTMAAVNTSGLVTERAKKVKESQGGTSVPHDYEGENLRMKQMEAKGRYAQTAGDGEFDPRNFILPNSVWDQIINLRLHNSMNALSANSTRHAIRKSIPTLT